MNLVEKLLTRNDCYNDGRFFNPTGIVVHSTGCNQTNLKVWYNSWNRTVAEGARSACVNAFIGKWDGVITTMQTLPWNKRPWGCGSGKNGSYNNTHIQFEICEDDLTSKEYFEVVYKEAVELCAMLCKKYNIAVKNVVTHCEAYKAGYGSNHADVMHWFPKFGKNMDIFRADVQKLIDAGEDKKETDKQPEKQEDTSVLYRVQVGAFSNLTNAKNLEADLKKKGFDTYLVIVDNLYKVQTGAFRNKTNANNLVAKIKAAGYDAFVTTKSGKSVSSTTTSTSKTIKVGDFVKVSNPITYNGKKFKVYHEKYEVMEVKGDRIVIGVKGVVGGAFKASSLTLC